MDVEGHLAGDRSHAIRTSYSQTHFVNQNWFSSKSELKDMQVEWLAQLADAQNGLVYGEVGSGGLAGVLEGPQPRAMQLNRSGAGNILSQYSLLRTGAYKVRSRLLVPYRF